MKSYEEILEEYLSEDGNSRDIIIDLANPLQIMVITDCSRGSISSISCCGYRECILRCIYINNSILELRELNFLLAYQIATLIKIKKKLFSLNFVEFDFDSDEFKLALKIYNRIYKDDKQIVQDVKTLKLKKNEMEVKNA